MPEILLAGQSTERRTGWMPELKHVNMLIEQSATNRLNGIDHIQRPGLRPLVSVGTGPIRGCYRQAGVIGGDYIVASGTALYRLSPAGIPLLIGSLPGTGRTTTAANGQRLIIVSGTTAYSTDGIGVAPVVMPDSRPVNSVAQLNGYFILAQNESNRFYWIEPGETNPDGLSFASAESSPDNIVKVERVGDELWFFGEQSTEVWQPTGNADLPFQRVPGRLYQRGCRNRDTVCALDNSVFWVGDDGIIYRGDNSPVRVSDHAMEERIRRSDADSLRAWSFAVDGHSIYCLTMDAGTYAYDVSSQSWSEFRSYGRDTWRAHVGCEGETAVLAGDDTTGQTYLLDPDRCNDAGQPMERIVTGGVQIVGKGLRCDSFDLYASTGTVADPNDFPKIRLSWSDDLETFGDFVFLTLQKSGNYGQPITLRRLGRMTEPGRLFEIQTVADCVVRISGAAINQAGGR